MNREYGLMSQTRFMIAGFYSQVAYGSRKITMSAREKSEILQFHCFNAVRQTAKARLDEYVSVYAFFLTCFLPNIVFLLSFLHMQILTCILSPYVFYYTYIITYNGSTMARMRGGEKGLTKANKSGQRTDKWDNGGQEWTKSRQRRKKSGRGQERPVQRKDKGRTQSRHTANTEQTPGIKTGLKSLVVKSLWRIVVIFQSSKWHSDSPKYHTRTKHISQTCRPIFWICKWMSYRSLDML